MIVRLCTQYYGAGESIIGARFLGHMKRRRARGRGGLSVVCHLDMPKVALFEDPPMSASGTVGGRLKGGWGSHWSSLVAVGRCGPGTELWQELCTNGTGNRHTLPPRHPVDGGAAPIGLRQLRSGSLWPGARCISMCMASEVAAAVDGIGMWYV